MIRDGRQKHMTSEQLDNQQVERAPRESLFILTLFTTPGGEYIGKARVRNLSATGMMADCEAPLGKDQRVQMDLRGVGRVEGRIVWENEGRVGVAFDREIDPRLVRRPVNASKSMMPDYLRMHASQIKR